jgi:hypothetical protein
MADPSLFDVLRIPTDVLIALDNRPLHFAMQPYHFVIRLVHVLAMGMFFGGIGLLDLRLMGFRPVIPLRSFAYFYQPSHYWSFVVTCVTGVALFAYDPVHVGSHAFFAPKMLLLVLALVNAAILHRPGNLKALAGATDLPIGARIAGGVSLAFWTGVVVFSSLNVEDMPKVFLR